MKTPLHATPGIPSNRENAPKPHPNSSNHQGRSKLPACNTPRMTETALNSLLDLRHQFLGFVQRRVNDRATAEDILQSAFVRTLDSGSQLREDDSAVAWFYRILRNAIIDYYRRRATEGAALERWVQELETEIQPDPFLHQTACQCIAGALDTLTPAYASLLREVDLAEATLSSYAHAHGITPGNAAVRAHRARAALRKQLTRSCGACATHGCLDCTCQTPAALQL
jgi:RNA polymerase sigma factor (sigma-70 family)